MIVGLSVFSLFQDAAWFILNRDMEEDDDDGGVERGVKGFSRKVSYLAFASRVSADDSLISLIFNFRLFADLDDLSALEGLPGLPEYREGQEHGQRRAFTRGKGRHDRGRTPQGRTRPEPL